MEDFWITYGEAAKTATGFLWKAGWAFVFGYLISAMIQVFVPKTRLTRHMGDPGAASVGLATVFGSLSSSCSFAALAAARALVQKGTHFVAAVAFMFASTNLVIELGILILIFLGWQFLAAEIVGGLLLIVISTILIRLTYPRRWLQAARERAEEVGDDENGEFDWRERIRSAEGWAMVGHRFVMEWQMVWREIAIGFTIAGFIAVFVPTGFWKAIFLAEYAQQHPGSFLIALQNALLAPFVAAATFIGSMGNIPLATVLNSGGVLFAGIMGFIYSDLMVPPLVKINAKYYGWRVALYIAAVMYASIVVTALVLHYAFHFTGLTPESARQISEITRFGIDYTFFLNLVAVAITGIMVWLHRRHRIEEGGHSHDEGGSGISMQTAITWFLLSIVGMGLVMYAVIGGQTA